jgi:hypothetical protein
VQTHPHACPHQRTGPDGDVSWSTHDATRGPDETSIQRLVRALQPHSRMTNAFLYDTVPHAEISSTLVTVEWGGLIAIALLVVLPVVVLAIAALRPTSRRRRLPAMRPLWVTHLAARRS